MKRCVRCVLTDALPSVRVDEAGICSVCRAQERARGAETESASLEAYRRVGGYDVLLAYSGGKDSSYTLYLLRHVYRLHVLAMVFDNGFLSPQAERNIRAVTEALDVDRIVIAPSFKKLRALFCAAETDAILPPKAMERASSICTYCISLVKAAAYREALQREIPLIAFGWTPGQIHMPKQVVQLDARMVKANFAALRDRLKLAYGEDYRPLFLSDELLDARAGAIPSLFYPFPEGAYDEGEILATLSKLGWVRPTDTDTNSSNCTLNAYAIDGHLRKYGFHPYATELAQLVREGEMTREEALARLETPPNPEIVARIRARLHPREGENG